MDHTQELTHATITPRARSLWPKEHGAYAQLGLPLATALVAGRPTIASIAFAIAAVAAFIAHEPAAVLLGLRGTRARRESGMRAWKWLAVVSALAIAFGLAALALDARSHGYAFIAFTCATTAALFVYDRKEKTFAGEIIIGVALASAAMPVGAASGLSASAIGVCFVAWSAQLAVSTVAVRALVARRRAWPTWLVVAGALGLAALVSPWVVLAIVPTCIVCLAVALSSLTARSIRALGISLAVAMTLSGAVLAYGARS